MPKIVWNNWLLVCTESTLTLNGTEIPASRMEKRLLLFLLDHPDIPLSRELLLREVWGYETAGITRTVDTHIKMLRAHLGKMGRLIISVRSVGYLFDTHREEADVRVCKAS